TEDRALFDRVRAVLLALQQLRQGGAAPAEPPLVRLGVTRGVAVRLLPALLRRLGQDGPGPPPPFGGTARNSDDLLPAAGQGHLDLALTVFGQPREPDGLVRQFPLHRCLLLPRQGPGLAGGFTWPRLRAWLAGRPGLTLAVLAHLSSSLHLPWQELKGLRVVQVPTLVEATALVRAGLCLTFAVTELLGEDEEREVHVVEVPGPAL